MKSNNIRSIGWCIWLLVKYKDVKTMYTEANIVNDLIFTYINYVSGPAKINHLTTKITNFFIFALSLFNNYLCCCNTFFITAAKFNGLYSAADGNGILHSEWKIISKALTQCNLHSHGWFSQTRSHVFYL